MCRRKKLMNAAFLRIIPLLALVAECRFLVAAPATITVFPSAPTVSLGNQVNVSLFISGLGSFAAPSVGTFDLLVSFDPTILSLHSVNFGDPTLGDQLDPTGLGNTISFSTPGFGTVGLFDLSLASASDLNNLQPASFILGTVIFVTIGTGTSSLD